MDAPTFGGETHYTSYRMHGDRMHRFRLPYCGRDLALWQPGQVQPGVTHRFAWTGEVPCTGQLRCTLCGKLESECTP
jgi:hypothetical protein